MIYFPHKTAIKRKEPSKPLKWLLKNISLKDKKLLDFGCGYGNDVSFLKKRKIYAEGYDKYLRINKEVIKYKYYDIVTCFYVLNTIAEEEEQINVAKDVAFLLKDDGLAVFAIRADEKFIKGQPYKKGVITSRKTFQRAYSFKDKEEIALILIKGGLMMVDFFYLNHSIIVTAKRA